MTALLDTHVLLWAAGADRRLPAGVQQWLKDRSNDLWVSDVTVWELAVKSGIGKLEFDEGLEGFLNREFSVNRYRSLEIRRRHLYRVETLPQVHRDPFDRLLVAQSLEEGLPVMSADPAFKQYPVETIW